MKRTKPLSIEEKAERIQALLRDTGEFYTLKELEKLSQKEKGVVPQSVKEVLEILVSEGRAKQEKVGISTLFWSYNSDTRIKQESDRKKLLEELPEIQKKELHLKEKISYLKSNRVEGEDRTNKLERYNQLKALVSSQKEDLQASKENDPNILLEKKEELKECKKEINKATENIFLIKDFLVKKFSIDEKEFNKNFSIPEDLDTV
ncbi:hypothetical protein NEFER03_1935 [Nematocida sp. LUAm3]|nr:hypothetical protein NEFER03_1935 [Nematocida sp. LUAm3]KAI5176163.1 hypothetical protein NEFER02_1977 [Nematocida sp. LUAm2]KAI5179257.1 hypothetical protein NEFER01_2109 [Nematocida sp. LUAm1]